MAYFDLKRSDAQFMFNLRGENHEVMLTSERYVTRQGALNGIAAVKQCAPYDYLYGRLSNRAGAAYFVLKSPNGQVLGISEAYSTTYARDLGIERVKAAAPSAAVHDNT